MRIVVVFPWAPGALSEAEESHRRALVAAAASPGTDVEFAQIDESSMFSEPFSNQNTSRVVGEIVQTIVLNWDWIGGARGLFVPIKRPDSLLNFQFHESKAVYYYIALGLLTLALGATRWIERSRRGYYFRAIKEDQDAAASLGVQVAHEKQAAMAVSAALTALGGTFWAQYVLFIDPESVFPLSLSILICLVAVMGGVGSLWGPLLGAAVLVPLSEGTRVLLGGTGKALDLVIYGALIMLIAVFQPAGLIGLVRQLAARPSFASARARRESAA